MSQRVHHRQTAEDITRAHPRTVGDNVFQKRKKAAHSRRCEKKKGKHTRKMKLDDRDKTPENGWFVLGCGSIFSYFWILHTTGLSKVPKAEWRATCTSLGTQHIWKKESQKSWRPRRRVSGSNWTGCTRTSPVVCGPKWKLMNGPLTPSSQPRLEILLLPGHVGGQKSFPHSNFMNTFCKQNTCSLKQSEHLNTERTDDDSFFCTDGRFNEALRECLIPSCV